MNVQAQLITLIGRVLPQADAVAGATEATRFIEDLSVSSINSIMLISLIESEFGLSGQELSAQLMTARTIGEASGVIEAQLEAAAK